LQPISVISPWRPGPSRGGQRRRDGRTAWRSSTTTCGPRWSGCSTTGSSRASPTSRSRSGPSGGSAAITERASAGWRGPWSRDLRSSRRLRQAALHLGLPASRYWAQPGGRPAARREHPAGPRFGRLAGAELGPRPAWVRGGVHGTARPPSPTAGRGDRGQVRTRRPVRGCDCRDREGTHVGCARAGGRRGQAARRGRAGGSRAPSEVDLGRGAQHVGSRRPRAGAIRRAPRSRFVRRPPSSAASSTRASSHLGQVGTAGRWARPSRCPGWCP
jgi:hypothetical protein